jgi:hypothetical protein
MDEFLNELYGTSETIAGEDLEKQAATEFLVKMAAEEGVDLDDLSDEEIGDLLGEIQGMGKEASAQHEAQTEEGVDDETLAKMAEADYLGRQMAHAYVAELAEIEKEAAGVYGPQISAARLGYRRLQSALGRAAGKAGEGAKAVGEWTGVSQIGRGISKSRASGKAKDKLVGQAQRAQKMYPGGKEQGRGASALKDRYTAAIKGKASRQSEGKQEAVEGLKRFGKRVAGPAAALEAARRVGKAQGESEKKSFHEEFEAAAQERAYEMLADAGYDVEKVAEADVELRALQMLEEAGYPVEWQE